MRQISLEKVPASARNFALSIDAAFTDYPERVYSVDMGLHDGTTWKIIELNAPQGLPLPSAGDPVPQISLLADHLLRFAHSPRH